MGVSRAELLAALGLIQVVEPITKKAYEDRELRIWADDLENSPHGRPWHTSFHASSFPGDDPVACGRMAVYGLLNVPDPEPTSRFLRSVADAGVAIEDEHVKRWEEAGRLLSNSASADYQTGFTDGVHWLTGNCDALLLPAGWTRPHVVEVKSKSQTKIDEMKNGTRGPDPKHRRQCLTYVGFMHEQANRFKDAVVCKHSWKLATGIDTDYGRNYYCSDHDSDECLIGFDLEPCTTGSIFYISRDDPSQTHEFFMRYDPDFMKAGREKLAAWKKSFEDGKLPERPRTEDGKLSGWSVEPCKWCDLKKHVCKPDYQAGIDNLSDSHAINFTKTIRPNYDLEDTRKAVLDRWK